MAGQTDLEKAMKSEKLKQVSIQTTNARLQKGTQSKPKAGEKEEHMKMNAKKKVLILKN